MLFYCIAALIVVTTVLYVVLVRAKAAEWTKPKKEKSAFENGFSAFPRLSVKVN